MGALLLLAALAGCGSQGAAENRSAPRHVGREIVVSGSVNRTIDSSSFVIASRENRAGVLVIGHPVALRAADMVEIRGVVRTFRRRKIEEELGRPLDDGRYAEFEGRDFIEADGVAVKS